MNDETRYGDPINEPFWDAAREHRLVVQRCESCGHHQFYGRPFCLQCQSDAMSWVRVSGRGTVYSKTRVQVSWIDGFEAPYTVALIDLEEGPRLLTNIVGGDAQIGDPVELCWRDRSDAPPVPLFRRSRP